MYGTVAQMTLKPGMGQQLADQLAGFETERAPGFIRTTVYRMDNDPNQYLVAVVFDSKEAYVANAESPEQNERFEAMAALLDGDPVWNDGEIIHST